ncbi:alpha/beta hydrolase family esterase [Kiloniella sp.]|uniref:alpha/beta hydrolase family esterase n=1 Tax=Kiloniella sp. TaxID=1938587 RepID=UPI003B01208E
MKPVETIVVIGLLLLGLVFATLSQAAPVVETRNVVGGRYVTVMPENMPVNTSLPVLFYYHGYGQSAQTVRNNKSLLRLASERGILLVIPDGLNRSWSNVGAPSEKRDEIEFTQNVLHDVRKNWKTQESRTWVTGFSQGGSMAWDVACYLGEEFSAFFPIAGSFWRPHPVTCESPVNIRHIHGLSDRVVPMKGRAIGARWHQGDVRQGVAIWEGVNGCEALPVEISLEDMDCKIWNKCRSGKALELCLHNGGHNVRTEWIARGIDWAESL